MAFVKASRHSWSQWIWKRQIPLKKIEAGLDTSVPTTWCSKSGKPSWIEKKTTSLSTWSSGRMSLPTWLPRMTQVVFLKKTWTWMVAEMDKMIFFWICLLDCLEAFFLNSEYLLDCLKHGKIQNGELISETLSQLYKSVKENEKVSSQLKPLGLKPCPGPFKQIKTKDSFKDWCFSVMTGCKVDLLEDGTKYCLLTGVSTYTFCPITNSLKASMESVSFSKKLIETLGYPFNEETVLKFRKNGFSEYF